jgi:protein-tyrosine phosphatase
VIDLHCHILPALDDGAIDMEDSAAMARQAEADGIELVCSTPHIHPDHEIRISELEGRVAAVNLELERQGIGVRVVQGGEIAEPIVDERDEEELLEVSLGRNGRWLLVEPRPGPIGDHTLETVDRLHERGFDAIIAHPERHPGADFRDYLAALVARGALIQVTSALIAEGPASQTLIDLAGQGLVHLLASDSHSSHGGRRLEISPGLARLRDVERTRDHIDWIANDAARAILRGEPAKPPFPCG